MTSRGRLHPLLSMERGYKDGGGDVKLGRFDHVSLHVLRHRTCDQVVDQSQQMSDMSLTCQRNWVNQYFYFHVTLQNFGKNLNQHVSVKLVLIIRLNSQPATLDLLHNNKKEHRFFILWIFSFSL